MSSSSAPAATTTAIAAGDIVRLKTGGPRMTVDAINSDTVSAVYFDTFNKLVKVELAVSSVVREETAA